MRGEDLAMESPVTIGEGSPPHARGRLEQKVNHIEQVGITPACAGKTSRPDGLSLTIEDHPRMRGEDAHHAQ